MKMTGVSVILLIILSYSLGQTQGEYRYANGDSDNPEWVQLMYSADPNTGEVVAAYELYYETHTLEKNSNTQYYKRWLRNLSREQVTNGRTASDKRYLAARDREKSASRSVTSEWVSLGPWDWDHDAVDKSYAPGAAHVYVIEQAQSNSDILYAGTATAGLWKSIDHGLSWTAISSDLLINGLTALEINHSNPNVVYAEILSNIYKTTDGGTTWLPTGNGAFQNLSFNTTDLVMDPDNAQIVWAATSAGLYRTTDGGANWSQKLGGEALEIEFHPTNSDIIYTVFRNGDVTEFYRSINAGTTFTQQTVGWPAPDTEADEHQRRTEIAVSLDEPNLVIALATGSANGGSGLYGIYKSIDSGVTWTFECCGPQPAGVPSETNMNLMAWSDQGLDDGGQYYYDLALDISPTNADSIFLAGVNVWVSGDGGASFVCPAKWSHSSKPEYVHADVHDIHYYANSGELWVSGDGGIFYSNDNGANFQRRITGISGTDFWGFGAGHRDGNVMLGGTYHNGTLLKDNDTYLNGWVCTDGGDNYRGFVHPVLDRQAFSDYNIKGLSGDRLVDNDTRTFAHKPNATYTIGRSSDLIFHPNYNGTWYSGSDSSLWKTEDNGYSFSEVHNFGGKVAALDICFKEPDVMYVSTFPDWWDDKKIFRTADGGESWTDITPPSSMLNGNLWVPYDIAASATNPDEVWIARTSMYSGTNFNGSVIFHSIDGGQNWTNYTSNFPTDEACTSIAHHLGSDGGVYIGTRRAVYYRNNTMTDWQLYSAGLPATTTCTRLLPFYGNQTIRNGSNRSVWERDLFENAAPIAQASVFGFEMRCLSDTVRYRDYSIISESNATWSWTFTGGTPATSTERDPLVTYSQPGVYDVELTVSDNYGTDTRIFNSMIKIGNECGLDTVPGLAMRCVSNPDHAVVESIGVTVDSLTIAAWVKPNGVQDDYTGILFNDGTSAGLNFRGGNNTLGYHWPGGSWSWNSGLIVETGVWSHVAMVVTNSQVRLYVNGVEAIHNTSPNSVDLGTMRIGSYKGWGSRNYRGLIDEVSMYNRALSIEEIRGLRHLTLRPTENTSLIAYYQFNAASTTIFNKAGSANATMNGSAIKIRSRAPLGSGVSQYMNVNGAGTYTYDTPGLAITFGSGSTTPQGDLYVSRLNIAPDTSIVGKAKFTDGYWILDNYGTNELLADPISMTFDPIGFVSESMVTTIQPLVFSRSSNAELADWVYIAKLKEVFVGVNGSLYAETFKQYIPGQILLARDSSPVGTPLISVGSNGYDPVRRGGGSVAFDLSTGNAKGLGLPVLNTQDFEQLESPENGMLAYHSDEKTLCFYSDSSWITVGHDYINIVPPDGTSSVSGMSVDLESVPSSAVLALDGGGLVLPNALTDASFLEIQYPPAGLIVYRLDNDDLVFYTGAEWKALSGTESELMVNFNVSSTTYPGIAVGIDSKMPGAALQISSENRGLGVPEVRVTTVKSPIEGLLVFDPDRLALCFFDGESWQQVSHH